MQNWSAKAIHHAQCFLTNAVKELAGDIACIQELLKSQTTKFFTKRVNLIYNDVYTKQYQRMINTFFEAKNFLFAH